MAAGATRSLRTSHHIVSAEDPIIDRTAQRIPGRRRLGTAVAAAVCGLVAFALYGQFAQNRQLDQRVNGLSSQNAQLEQQIHDRQTEIALAQTPAWLREQARKLGYVLPGEHIYVLMPPGGQVPSHGGVVAPLPSFSPSPSPTPTPAPQASPTPTYSAPTPQPFQLPTPSPTP